MGNVIHRYVDGCTIIPANGTAVSAGDTVVVVATPTDPLSPVTLLLVDGVDYAEMQQGAAYAVATVVVPASGNLEVGALCSAELPASVPDYAVQVPHVIYSGVADDMPNQPSALIFPSGNWMFSVITEIVRLNFSIKELLAAPKAIVPGQGAAVIWARTLNFEGKGNYGLIDWGVPFYVDEIGDFGGGQVARWKKFVRFDYPWRDTIVPNLIGWLYTQSIYPGGNFFLDNLGIAIQSWSKDAVCGGWEDRLPTRNADPTGIVASLFGIPAGAVGYMSCPWDSRGKGRHHYVFCDFKHMDTDGSIYTNTPQGKKKFYHLYHVIKRNTTIRPDHGTTLLEGSSVAIFTKATAGNLLDLFTVDSVDRLTGGAVDTNSGENYYIKTNVNADVYVSSSAEYDAPDAVDGTPYSFQCTCPVCGTTTWSATGLPTGLSINAATGLISGTVPYDTVAADYTVTVTAVNNGNTVSRTFTMSNTFVTPPVPGMIWTAVGKLDSKITAMVQAANGDVIIATDAPKVYTTSDFLTFTPVLVGATTTFNKITLLASGRLIAVGNGPAPECASYSDDNGATWTGTSPGIGSEIYRDSVELSPTLFIAAGGDAGSAYSNSSVDAGLNYTGWWSYYNVGLLNGFSKVIKLDATSMLAIRDRNNFRVIKCVGGATLGTVKYNIVGSDGTQPSCNFVVRSDGKFLFGAYNELHIGTADGETWALHQTLPDWGGIATPGIAYSMCSEPAESAVWVAIVGGLGITHVLRSVDDGANFVASVTDIDGSVAPVMIQLANRNLILGTNGATNNIWKSVA